MSIFNNLSLFLWLIFGRRMVPESLLICFINCYLITMWSLLPLRVFPVKHVSNFFYFFPMITFKLQHKYYAHPISFSVVLLIRDIKEKIVSDSSKYVFSTHLCLSVRLVTRWQQQLSWWEKNPFAKICTANPWQELSLSSLWCFNF